MPQREDSNPLRKSQPGLLGFETAAHFDPWPCCRLGFCCGVLTSAIGLTSPEISAARQHILVLSLEHLLPPPLARHQSLARAAACHPRRKLSPGLSKCPRLRCEQGSNSSQSPVFP